MPEQNIIGPQPGPQLEFLSTSAEIAIFGGSAGGGKSWILLYEPLRNVINNPRFAAVLFRRNLTEHKKPGATWDESMILYGNVKGAVPTQFNLEWRFKAGGRITLAHLEYDHTVLEWHSAQVPLIEFDELTEFSAYQFWYMLSRNRSLSGVPGYVRATCNPDANSWVAELIAWWIDQETGYPIKERSGVVRYFLRIGDELIWADRKEDLTAEKLDLPKVDRDGREIPYMPKSFTFIASDIYDNQILLKQNPEYLANLLALPTVERERLLRGNWKIKPSAGLYFKREWVKIIRERDLPPLASMRMHRGWDLAATEKTALNSPDWTCGTKIGKFENNYYILHHTYIQKNPSGVEMHLKLTAAGDGLNVKQILPKDPGQAGKWQATYLQGELAQFPVEYSPETGDKFIRFGPFSSQAQSGHIFVVEGLWNERFFSVLEGFGSDYGIDDDVDSTSRAFNSFLDASTGLLDYYLQMSEEIAREAGRIYEKPPTSADQGGVLVRCSNPSTNMITDARSNPIWIRPDGCFMVSKEHAAMLMAQGFTLAEAEVVDLTALLRQRAQALIDENQKHRREGDHSPYRSQVMP